MKKFLVFLCAVMLVFGTVGMASANLIGNGDFEAMGGSFDQWQTSGDMRIGMEGFISGIQGMDDHYALFGYGLGNDVSRLRQDFDITGIDMLHVQFDWAFDFLDFNPFGDDTFVSFFRQNGPRIKITLQDLNTSGIVGLHYGHYDKLIDISAFHDGDARLGFKLEEGAALVGSAAGIDNVNIAPVPEPSTILLLGLGLIGMAGYGRKRFSKKG